MPLCVVLSSIWRLTGSDEDETPPPPKPPSQWLCSVFNVFAVAGIFLSTYFFYFLPPSLIYHWECLFHLLTVHPRAISCSNRRLSFSIRISPLFLLLFKLSCLTSRLSSRIKLDVCPWVFWSCPLGSILGLIVIPDPEGAYLLSLICSNSSLLCTKGTILLHSFILFSFI